MSELLLVTRVSTCTHCKGKGEYRQNGLLLPCDCQGGQRIESVPLKAALMEIGYPAPDAIKGALLAHDSGKIPGLVTRQA